MFSAVVRQFPRVIRSRVTSRMLNGTTKNVKSSLSLFNLRQQTPRLNEKDIQKRFFSRSKACFIEDGKPKRGDDEKAISVRDKPTTLVASTVSTVYPISKRTLYPGLRMPLPLSKMALSTDAAENVALFYVKEGPVNPDDNTDNKPKVHDIGYWAIILNEKLAPGYPLVEVQPLRVQITEIISTTPFRANVKPLADEPYDPKDPEIEQKLTTLKLTLMQIYEILAQRQSHEVDYIHRFLDMLKLQKSLKPSIIADTCMQFLPNFDSSELQQVVEALNVKKRLDVVISLLRKQYAVLKDAFHLSQTFTIDKESKESYLNEELKKLQKESGIASDEKEKLLEKYKQRMENKNIPDDVKRVIKEEMDKLMSLEPMLMEYGVTNNYLDWLTALPWGVFSQDKYDIPHARKVLDEDHYGLKDIKERILEFISVGSLTGNVQGKILCLVGPPGTGKTSIGQSIARALDRKFFRFSVGGMNDVAEIKGHRRTYVGAMPGKFVQCLKLRETSNPVILIDEIDKVGNSVMGDPSSALLEALDPQQNATFLDHYLDVPYDLSKVLFVCTANVLDTIPRPLLDRMEVLTLSGYVLDEKMSIVKRHLLPNARKNTQLKSNLVKVTDSAIKKLIHQYCREAGVRQLQKQIDNIFSKAAYKLQKEKQTKGTETPITVNHDNLEEYVGKPKYTTDRHYQTCPPGVIMGLSWTPMGGSALYVETVVEGPRDHDEGLRTTGQMGEVMKESSNIAFTYARNFLHTVAPENRFFEQYSVHMHLPEGATSKDGPSAGVPMVTSLLSSVIDDMAISGEITLSGKILPVGAIKEKIIAASRANIKHVILPVDNKVDWEELEENITKGITPHFVEYYKDVYEIAFGLRDHTGDGSGGKVKANDKDQKKKNDNTKEKKQVPDEKKDEKPKRQKKNSPKPVRKQKNEIELPPQPHKNPDANQIIVNNTKNPVSDN